MGASGLRGASGRLLDDAPGSPYNGETNYFPQGSGEIPETAMNSTALTRFFGGSPGRVLVQLAVMSFVLGVILSALGLSPFDIVESLQRLVQRVWNMGFDAITWGFRYFLLGAVIVVPVWLVMRLFRFGRRGGSSF